MAEVEDGPVTEKASGAAAAAGEAEEDPEKKRKKEEKLKEKEAKKAKAKAKAEAAAAAAAAKGANSKADGPAAEKKGGKAGGGGVGGAAAALASAVDEVELARATPKGHKKDVSGEMPKAYNPRAVELAWYDWWQQSGFFSADPASKKPKFVVVIPPPNVTGSLHIGHALANAVEDACVRWRRMSGYEALWVPGTDHAGIATQTVVEKTIAKQEKKSRHDLGREEFIKRVWEWKVKYESRILDQLKRLGVSVDWDRLVFTMDDTRYKAVMEAFVRMHADGLIYRDNRLVNWDCRLRTAISDIEVDYITIEKRTLLAVPGYKDKVEFGAITSFAYLLEDGADEIIIATTRPETMLGDTAVAVHPDDERYKRFHGKFVVHPFNGRRLPIITDAVLVDMSFGTGAVKITPAHDPNDFETGRRHNLQFINILTDDGCINSNGGEGFVGLPRFEARTAVIKALQDKGLYRGAADNPMRLGVCSRSNDVIEPVIKPQWYVKCGDMAANAAKVVTDGDMDIVPKVFEDVWFRWMENIRDWCVSRQLWWGHRIPAWHASLPGEPTLSQGGERDTTRWVVARNEDEARAKAVDMLGREDVALEQDPDVLDTWFSSGLFPFSVFGWPDNTPDLQAFYPTSLLETGHDILFFWVARMVMMGLQLTQQVPFKQVFLHAMVRDAHGRKMSKSLGNVIDPLEVIEGVSLEELHAKLEQGNLEEKEVERAKAAQKEDFPDGIAECGTDALRFALLAYTTQPRDINLDVKRVVGYRMWCNKLWNATRFALMNLTDFTPHEGVMHVDTSSLSSPLAVRWVLSRLNNAINTTVKAFEAYEFANVTTSVYAFWQYELCDVYIELMKPLLTGPDVTAKQHAQAALWTCLDCGLRLLHPIMPFVTEELWQRLPRTETQRNATPSICVAEYPKHVDAWVDEDAERVMSIVDSAARATRQLRMAYNVPPKQRVHVSVLCRGGEDLARVVEGAAGDVATLAGCARVDVLKEGESAPPGSAVGIVDDAMSVYLHLRGVVDPATELDKLRKREEETRKSANVLEKKMNATGYVDKVPHAVQDDNRAKAAKLQAELDSIAEAAEAFHKLLLE
eukprot:jgi/Chlat1/7573/Chrsp63S07062